MRAAISASSSRGVKSTRRLTKLKRTPRTPASCRSSSSRSVTASRTVATPRALPPLARQASAIARLSAPWQVACTIDVAREAEVVAQREQLRLARVARGVLPLGRVRKLRARAEHVAVRVHRAGRRREPRLARARAPVEPAGRLLEGRPSTFRFEDPVGLDAPVRAAGERAAAVRLPNTRRPRDRPSQPSTQAIRRSR